MQQIELQFVKTVKQSLIFVTIANVAISTCDLGVKSQLFSVRVMIISFSSHVHDPHCNFEPLDEGRESPRRWQILCVYCFDFSKIIYLIVFIKGSASTASERIWKLQSTGTSCTHTKADQR